MSARIFSSDTSPVSRASPNRNPLIPMATAPRRRYSAAASRVIPPGRHHRDVRHGQEQFPQVVQPAKRTNGRHLDGRHPAVPRRDDLGRRQRSGDVAQSKFGGSVHQLGQEDLADGEVGAGVSGRTQIVDGPYGADAQHEIPQSFARTDERVQRALGGQGVLLAGNSGVSQHVRGALEVLGIWCSKKGYNRSRR